ncbi:MAG: hypothetical protein ACLFNC_05100 [Halodesulfurarchaeum sp.]
MSGAAPTREVAYRVFAAEFAESTYSYAESDDERAPQYLVTPTGARINRIFVVGVLTETEEVSDGVLRARIVDPTGAFVLYAGQYQPEALAFFERADPPVFVSLTGKARTFEPDGSDRVLTSLRPERVNEVDAETRDSWVVQTALHTLERTGVIAQALELDAREDDLSVRLTAAGVEPGLAAGIPRAIREYEPTTGYLETLQQMALDAVRVVAGEIGEVSAVAGTPSEGGDGEVLTGFTDVSLAGTAGESTEPTSAARESPEATEAKQKVTTEAEPDVTEPTDEETAETAAEPVDEAPVEAEPDEDGESAGTEPVETGPDEEEPAEKAHVDESEAELDTESTSAPTSETEAAVEAEPEPESESDGSAESGEADAEKDGASSGGSVPPDGEANLADEPEESDELYELSDAERAEVEANYDVGFESGAEIGSPEETEDIEPETGDDGTEESAPATEGDNEAESPAEGGDGTDSAAKREEATDSPAEGDLETDSPGDSEASPEETEAGDRSKVDRQDLVVETLQELGDGAGVPRTELIETLQDRHDLDEAEIEDAIEAALLGGRCFESGSEDLKPI